MKMDFFSAANDSQTIALLLLEMGVFYLGLFFINYITDDQFLKNSESAIHFLGSTILTFSCLKKPLIDTTYLIFKLYHFKRCKNFL